jgi:phosphopantothenoylcysteine decarboxylase/phosphopantothenate--cysteine ligase
VVVSAGGTREPIDPVRFVSNYSSGKMGYAVAQAAAERGAQVVLVSSAQHPSHAGLRAVPVETAAEMLEALKAEVPGADLLVMAAAVADFRPAHAESRKIRREERDELVLKLEKNVDILAELSKLPGVEGVYRVGFAAEGGELEQKAVEKLSRKGLDAIVANDISRRDIAFGSEYNEGLMVFRDGKQVQLERATKREMADRILDEVVARLR